MQAFILQLASFGAECLSLLFFLEPCIKLVKNSIHENSIITQNKRLAAKSQNIKNFIIDDNGNKVGVINVYSDNSIKVFQHGRYKYLHQNVQDVLKNVSGGMKRIRVNRGYPHYSKIPLFFYVDFMNFDLHKSAFQQQTKILNPKNNWSQIVDFIHDFNKQIITESKYNKYSLTKLKIGITTSFAIFGQIQIDQVRNITKIVPKVVAATYEDIQKYFEHIEKENLHKFLLATLGIGIISLIGYFVLKRRIKRMKQQYKTFKKQKLFISNQILCDPSTKLKCKRCKNKDINTVLQCNHLSICQECYNVNKICPECNKVSNSYVKIYL